MVFYLFHVCMVNFFFFTILVGFFPLSFFLYYHLIFSIKMFSLLRPSQFLISLWCKDNLAKAMVFPEVMCGFGSWTIKKAECHRIDANELWW